MDLLIKLLGIDVPANTSLQSAELSLRGPVAGWLATLVLVAVIAWVIYLYRLEKGTMGWPRRALMTGLRVALLALLLLLLFRPILLTEFEGQKARNVVVLLDNSQSMNQHDCRLTMADKMRVALAKGLIPLDKHWNDVPSEDVLPADTPKDPARADLVRWVLLHPELKLIRGLEKIGPVNPYLFGYSLRGMQDEGGKDKTLTERLLGSFKADQNRTNLADAVVEILQRKDGALPAAMVILSDGQDNASKYTLQEAAVECARLKVPLHIYGVGTTEGERLQLKEVGVPETIFVEDTISVPLRWRAQGFKKGSLDATITLGGKVVAKQSIPNVMGEDQRKSVSFKVPRGNGGEEHLPLAVTLRAKGQDSMAEDSMTRTVQVVDRKIRVLYIEHSARFVYQFLMGGLERDRRVERSVILVNADPRVAQSGPPFLPGFPPTREKFFDAQYNVIILGDVSATYLGKEHMEWIKEFVENRGGLIVIAGRQHMPSTYENSPLAEVLPAKFESRKFSLDADLRTQEYPVSLTEVGKRSNMLSLADTPEENIKEWAKLPGFYWQYPMTELRPGGISLLENPRVKMGDQQMPVLATQYYGKGQVLFMASDEAWRWRFNEADKVTNRFWGQIVYQMGLPSLLGQASKRVQVALERSEAILNVPGSIFVRLLDKEYNPRKDDKVNAVLEYLDAKPGQEKTRKITFQALSKRPGEYAVAVLHDQPGRWELKINNPETTSYQFRVELPPRHELEETVMAEGALRDMAEISGGKFYREEDLHQLVAEAKPQTTSFARRQEVVLWNPLALILFLMLITAEWVLRKFSNLS